MSRLNNNEHKLKQKAKVFPQQVKIWFKKKKKIKNTDLLFDIFKWWGGDDRETYKEHISLWIAERTQPVIILLTWEEQSQQTQGSLFFWSLKAKIRENKRDVPRHQSYLQCQKGRVYRAPPQSSLSLHNCQKPVSTKPMI